MSGISSGYKIFSVLESEFGKTIVVFQQIQILNSSDISNEFAAFLNVLKFQNV